MPFVSFQLGCVALALVRAVDVLRSLRDHPRLYANKAVALASVTRLCVLLFTQGGYPGSRFYTLTVCSSTANTRATSTFDVTTPGHRVYVYTQRLDLVSCLPRLTLPITLPPASVGVRLDAAAALNPKSSP